jgi:hypothetical protein
VQWHFLVANFVGSVDFGDFVVVSTVAGVCIEILGCLVAIVVLDGAANLVKNRVTGQVKLSYL